MRIFGQLLLVDKQKVPYMSLYKTTSKQFEFFQVTQLPLLWQQ
jgi:hypothetical protein